MWRGTVCQHKPTFTHNCVVCSGDFVVWNRFFFPLHVLEKSYRCTFLNFTDKKRIRQHFCIQPSRHMLIICVCCNSWLTPMLLTPCRGSDGGSVVAPCVRTPQTLFLPRPPGPTRRFRHQFRWPFFRAHATYRDPDRGSSMNEHCEWKISLDCNFQQKYKLECNSSGHVLVVVASKYLDDSFVGEHLYRILSFEQESDVDQTIGKFWSMLIFNTFHRHRTCARRCESSHCFHSQFETGLIATKHLLWIIMRLMWICSLFDPPRSVVHVAQWGVWPFGQ